jgi:hypothetical protein
MDLARRLARLGVLPVLTDWTTAMKIHATAAGLFALATSSIASIGGLGIASAQPGDYSMLPVNPNVVTDSNAYTSAAPIVNPNGQQGVTAVYNHRDGSRQITNTVLILPDAAAATAAVNTPDLANRVVNVTTQPLAVGNSGTMVSGTSPDGSKAVTVVRFAEGNAATTMEFDGPKNDAAPADLVTEFARAQDNAIKGWWPA